MGAKSSSKVGRENETRYEAKTQSGAHKWNMTLNASISTNLQHFSTIETALESWGCVFFI